MMMRTARSVNRSNIAMFRIITIRPPKRKFLLYYYDNINI